MPTMPTNHPDREQLRRFLSGELDRTTQRSIVRHLLRGCARCVAVTRAFWTPAAATEPMQATQPDDAATRARRRWGLAQSPESSPRGVRAARAGSAEVAERRARRLYARGELAAAELAFLAAGRACEAAQALLERTRLAGDRDAGEAVGALSAALLALLRCRGLTVGDAAALLFLHQRLEVERSPHALLGEVARFLAQRAPAGLPPARGAA